MCGCSRSEGSRVGLSLRGWKCKVNGKEEKEKSMSKIPKHKIPN